MTVAVYIFAGLGAWFVIGCLVEYGYQQGQKHAREERQ
jgi:hypothetical protein